MQARISKANIILIGILIVAAILRLQDINQPFIDATSWRQSSTAMMAENFYHRNWNIFYPEISWDGPGPSYNGREFQLVSYLAALLYTVVGQHDWVGRAIAITFGLWGIYALYQLVLRVWDKKRAITSAAAMAVLPGSIYIDRTFIPDPAMVALVTTSCWLLVAYCQTGKKRDLLLASLTGMLGFLTKITGLLVGLPMLYAISAILGFKELVRSRKGIEIVLASAITLAPVIAYYLWARHLSLNYPPYHFAGNSQGNWIWNSDIVDLLQEKYGISKTIQIFRNWMWTFPFTVLILLGFLKRPVQGLFLPQSNQSGSNSSEKAIWFFHWWVLGGTFYYLIGVGHLLGNPYNFHIINPPAAAFAGDGIITLSILIKRALGKQAAIAIISAILLTISSYGQKNIRTMYYPYAQQGYELGLALRQFSKPGDLVTTITNDIGDPVAIYYSQRRGWKFTPSDSWSVEVYDESQVSELEKLRERGATWLGIVGDQYDKLKAGNRTFLNYINRTCKLVQKSDEWAIYHILKNK
jgi:4-amino-4-deoxy-L-arabinose transferase-like glycosyltransferase